MKYPVKYMIFHFFIFFQMLECFEISSLEKTAVPTKEDLPYTCSSSENTSLVIGTIMPIFDTMPDHFVLFLIVLPAVHIGRDNRC